MRPLLISLIFSVLFPVHLRADELLVFAAVSLSGPLDAVVDRFEADTGHAVTVSYGASSTLARQIAAGAPADVVVLANEAWMDELDANGRLMLGTRHVLMTNRLVLIETARMAEPRTLASLPDIIGRDRMALALTQAVPAGIYAREALTSLNLWDRLEPNIVESDNVRTAQALVAIGAARFGIVYATDVAQEPRVRVVAEIPETSHSAITYPMAVIEGAGDAAMAFTAALGSLPARNIFGAVGFDVIGP